MNLIDRYLLLPDHRRSEMRASNRDFAVAVQRRYAALLAAEAAIAAWRVQPDAARLVFALTEDVLTGPSARLIAAYDIAGRRLWDTDRDDEWPDESLVTDWLAAASRCYPGGYFPPAREDSARYEYKLPTPPVTSAPPAGDQQG